MVFELYREPGGWLSLSLRGYPYIGYYWLRWRLVRALVLQKCGVPVKGFHDHAQCYQSGDGLVVIGWDIRRGFVVSALERGAEPLLHEAGRVMGRPASCALGVIDDFRPATES